MPNAIDGELYPDNNSHTTAHPMRWQLNPTTGIEEQVPITGLTDLKAYLSLTELAASESEAVNAALVITLTEVLTTAAYQGTFSGASKRTYLGAQPDSTKVYCHWQSVSAGYHEVAEIIWRPKRPAALA